MDVNDTIILPITFANATDIGQITLELVYDPGIVTVQEISTNADMPSSTVTYTIDDGTAVIELTNPDNITITTATPLIDIALRAGENTGTTALDLQNVELTDETRSHAPATIINGNITVCIKGDFNNNNRVDIGDAAKVAFMVAGKVDDDLRADFNNNSRVDIGDAAKISFYLAEKVSELREEKTPLQEKLAVLSKVLSVGILGICFVILGIGLFTGRDFFEMFLMAVAIAVSAIPEGLLVAVTVVLTIGMQRILKHKALVRKLIAAETLGATTVICADKTGTLTQGKMQVSQILTFNKDETNFEKIQESHTFALKIGMLCNNAVIENPDDDLEKWKIHGDPTEKAFLLAGMQSGLNKKILEKRQIMFLK